MKRGHSQAVQRGVVLGDGVALVFRKAVPGILAVEVDEERIAVDLRHDKGRRDGDALGVTVNDPGLGNGHVVESPGVDEKMRRGHGEGFDRPTHRQEPCVVDIDAIDLLGLGASDAPSDGVAPEDLREALPSLPVELLRVVDAPGSVSLGENDRGRDHRPDEGTHAHLVDARDERDPITPERLFVAEDAPEALSFDAVLLAAPEDRVEDRLGPGARIGGEGTLDILGQGPALGHVALSESAQRRQQRRCHHGKLQRRAIDVNTDRRGEDAGVLCRGMSPDIVNGQGNGKGHGPRRAPSSSGTAPLWGGLVALIAFMGCGMGCGHSASTAAPREPSPTLPSAQPSPDETELRRVVQRFDLALDAPNGLSGLTRSGDGTLWAVAETDRQLVVLRGDRVERLVPLVGFPEELDAESIAWLGGDTFAVGTESNDENRNTDTIYVVGVDGTDARVVEERSFPYEHLAVRPAHNKGIEGICAVDGLLVAGVEPTVTRDGARLTAVALRSSDGAWTNFEVALTSPTGKLSALACRRGGSGLEVFAVERHYEVMRILRFELALGGNPNVIEPEVMLDLAGELEGDPNLEGLAIDGEDLVLINDNFYGERRGPNELLRLTNVLR